MTGPTPPDSPTIRTAGSKAIKPRKLFVNIPVTDLQRSIVFFETLGFTFNPQFTDASATCMVVGEDAYFMLLTRDRFTGFSERPMGNPRAETNALFAITVGSRAEVDALADMAIAAGGSPAVQSQDHGFMYVKSFRDLDGHHWEVFWMDMSAMPT